MPSGRLPTFIIIGAQKAATTSLWAALRSHEQVYCPLPKEPRFFSPGEPMQRGREWYAGLFANAGNALAVGEAFYHVLAPAVHVTDAVNEDEADARRARIHEQCGVVKFGKDKSWIIIVGEMIL